jgi:hypothetical protein
MLFISSPLFSNSSTERYTVSILKVLLNNEKNLTFLNVKKQICHHLGHEALITKIIFKMQQRDFEIRMTNKIQNYMKEW